MHPALESEVAKRAPFARTEPKKSVHVDLQDLKIRGPGEQSEPHVERLHGQFSGDGVQKRGRSESLFEQL